MREASESGQIRKAAIDVLVRNINSYLPSGWGKGDRLEFQTASALVWLLSALAIDAGAPELEAKAKRVWSELHGLQPPVGWLPASCEDPLIQQAFALGWPDEMRNANAES
jgi:hypothetical protein